MDGLLNLELEYFVMKRCGTDWRLPHSIVDCHCMVLLMEGTTHYLVNGAPLTLRGGQMLLVPPGSSRSATTEGMSLAALDFTLKRGRVDLPLVMDFEPTRHLRWLLREMEYEWVQRGDGYREKCGAQLVLLLHALRQAGPQESTASHVENIKRFIVRHSARPLTVQQVADAVGLSPVYCGALFKKSTGLSIHSYISRIRVQNAAAMLAGEGCTVTQAAYACGFSDICYFSNQFKRLMGVAPSAYKRQQPGHGHAGRQRQLDLLSD